MKEGWVDFGQAQADLVRYSNTMLAILYDSGVISKKRFQNTLSKWPNYVPMFRTFDERIETRRLLIIVVGIPVK